MDYSRRNFMEAVSINVGANTNKRWCGFRAPVFNNFDFEFIHIPWKEKYGIIEPTPLTYEEKYGQFSSYVIDTLKKKWIFESPNFQLHTFASTDNAPANKSIFNLKPNDYLFFHATLDRYNQANQRIGWGIFIVGYFKIKGICNSFNEVTANKSAKEDFKDYQWFKIFKENKRTDNSPWIKGQDGKSGLLKKAIPLTEPSDPYIWNEKANKLLRTQNKKHLGNRANPRIILTSSGDNLEKLLSICELRT